VEALGGMADEADVDGRAVAGHDLAQEVRVVLQVESGDAVLAAVLRRKAQPLVHRIAGVVEERDEPAHVHVPVGIPVRLRHREAKAGRGQGGNPIQWNRGRFHLRARLSLT